MNISNLLCPDTELSELDIQQLSKSLPRKQKDASMFTSGVCCVTGEWGDHHLRRELVFSDSTGNTSNLAPYNTDCISISAYKLWKEPKVWARSVLATPGRVLFPTIAQGGDRGQVTGDSKNSITSNLLPVTSHRPTWRDALRQLDISLERVCILTTDPKKRIWPFAQISQGETIKMYLHDPSRGISENRSLNYYTLLNTLSKIEDIYTTYGFSKGAIASSLISDFKTAQKVGIEHTMNLDEILSEIRELPEFTPALIIAQKIGDRE